MARVIVAFVVSPAVVPVGVVAWALASSFRFQESVIVASIYAAFTYGAAVVLGIPAFLAFSRRGWTRLWQYAVGGAAIAIAVLAGMSVAAAESFFRLPILLLFIAMGVITTTVFWSIGIATWSQRFYHGTKADLKPGDLIRPGYNSNFGKRKNAAWVYLTATLDAATWGAELALGEGRGRIYIVEPTGPFEDDPNLTDKKFPGNPTKSYRTRDPLRVTGEVTDWQGHPPEQLQAMKDSVERLKQLGVEAIED